MAPSKQGFLVGKKVKLLTDREPYYSGYAGNPRITIPAGEIGVIGATDVPYIVASKNPGRGDYFVCVDFALSTPHAGHPPCYEWRVSANPREIALID